MKEEPLSLLLSHFTMTRKTQYSITILKIVNVTFSLVWAPQKLDSH
jgi:hypothetical protein